MKIRLLSLLFAVSFFAGALVSCEKDIEKHRNTNFDVPELTDDNTVQFTVDAKSGAEVYFRLLGGKIAVDWGDGHITKDIDPTDGKLSRPTFSHRYRNSGEYRIKIWSEELTEINMHSGNGSYGELRLGNCPLLNRAWLYSFRNGTTLDLNGCSVLEALDIDNCPRLESVALDRCSRLKYVGFHNNPNLSALDLSRNNLMVRLYCWDNGVRELNLPNSVDYVSCRNNAMTSLTIKDNLNLKTLLCYDTGQLTTLDLDGCDNLESLMFPGTSIAEFDFSEFPRLMHINCKNTKMSNVNVIQNCNLIELVCSGLALTSLDISGNTRLQTLDCSWNQLTALDVSNNTKFRYLYINDNKFAKKQLEDIFEKLPPFDPKTATRMPPPSSPSPSSIKILNNPGAAACNTSIITGKGWVIKTN